MTRTRILWGISGAGLLALGGALGVVMLGRGDPQPGPSVDGTTDGKSSGEQRLKSAEDRDAVRSDIVAFCGDCHALPNPASFPREDWPKEVWQGFDFYTESGRNDLHVPAVQSAIDFFRSQAPEKLVLPDVRAERSESPVLFRAQPLQVPHPNPAPAMAFVQWMQLDPGGPGTLVYCDMSNGDVGMAVWKSRRFELSICATLNNPCHAELADLDGDSRRELVVADLGSFLPEDHDRGRVVRLYRPPGGNTWQTEVLADGLGRVADARPADFDGDGDADLVVAEFGWRRTGRILLLRNQTVPGMPLKFDTEVLDKRHGTIHVPVADLNRDGRPDFVALISQEHEVVEAFINEGDGAFRVERIHAAGDPAFGSSGIELTDLDGDGDLDVLYVNGDTIDSYQPKPYHAIHWLENRGDYPFTHHRLGTLPGVSRAVAADIDNDGRMDVAAAGWLLDRLRQQFDAGSHDSVVWLRQHHPGKFSRHQIEAGNFQHMCITTADIDEDGDLDVITANFSGARFREGPALTVFWNDGARPGAE